MNSSWIGNELLFNCSLCDRGQEGVIKLVCGNGNCFFWLEYRVGLFIFMGEILFDSGRDYIFHVTGYFVEVIVYFVKGGTNIRAGKRVMMRRG